MSDKPFEKKTTEIKVHVGETLKADLMALAFDDGFEDLSPFIRKILRMYAYKGSPTKEQKAQMVRDD